MTVEKLKEKLEEYPDDAVVQILEWDCGDYDIIDLEESHIYLTCDNLFLRIY